MTAFRSAALIALIALTGCGEDGDRFTVTLVNRDMSYDRSYFTDDPLVAEIHNAPFDGLTPEDTATLLRLPQSYGDPSAFAYAAPGQTPPVKVRLTIAFNSRAPLSAQDLCTATTPLGASTPLDVDRFMADMALCRDDVVIASASMIAKTGADRDPAFAARSLQHLMLVTFGNHAERAQWER
jgi:hypothetical protein